MRYEKVKNFLKKLNILQPVDNTNAEILHNAIIRVLDRYRDRVSNIDEYNVFNDIMDGIEYDLSEDLSSDEFSHVTGRSDGIEEMNHYVQ